MEDVLLQEVKKYFGEDIRRIKHAERVLFYSKIILETVAGDDDIVVPAAILHDIGIHECERKYNSNSGKLQEIESPTIAYEIMSKLGMKIEKIDEVCEIIANHHTPQNLSSNNFRVLLDADLLVNLIEENKIKKDSFNRYKKYFWTNKGKEILRELAENYGGIK